MIGMTEKRVSQPQSESIKVSGSKASDNMLNVSEKIIL